MNLRPLLILDLDETLIHASEHKLEHKPHLVLGEYLVYKRPYLDEFLHESSRYFDLAVWSSASEGYVSGVVREVIPDSLELQFAWGRSRCVQSVDRESRQLIFRKDLRKVTKKRFDLNRILIVDNDSQKLRKNYGNAIYIKNFCGNPEDDELLLLKEYLKILHDKDDFRKIEKRNWRSEALELRRETALPEKLD